MAAEGCLRVGTVQQSESTLGSIEPDTGEEHAIVDPSACVGFDSTIPPVGTRVVYRQSSQQQDGSHETLAADVFPEDHDFLGTMVKDNGSFGFIQVDGKEDRVFVMPIACSAFGGRIPPLQTPVKFKVVMDHKTGRPRVDFVRQSSGAKAGPAERPSVKRERPDVERPPGEVYTGQVSRVKGNFGFIQPDDSSDEIFFMPRGFKAFYGMPPAGMRVGFQIVMDEKTGRPRADNIYPEATQGEGAPAELLRTGASGIVTDPGDKFGFITQDDWSSMFLLPGSCPAFGMVIPAAGTRVFYDVVLDPKTGRPRAEDVKPFDSGGLVTALKGKGKGGGRPAIGAPPANAGGRVPQLGMGSPGGIGGRMGVVSRICNGFGFIDQEDGESMFVLPASCRAFYGGAFGEIPPVGTMVEFDVVTDSKTGKPRAEDVRPATQAGFFAGTVVKSGGQFGFINQDTQDGTEVSMFVLPHSCGGQIPPVGTRVTYTVVEDAKTGRPRAEEVMVLAAPNAASAPMNGARESPAAQPIYGKGGGKMNTMDMWMSGTISQVQPTYGFIQPDDDQERMFVLPGSCTSCGDGIPPVGTRVMYRVVADMKTGKPRAEDVNLEAAERAGSIMECGERYGFILEDSGEKMFLMPASCSAFGSVIPPEGTRVTFRVVPDRKTGRPRAEDVCPEAAAQSNYGSPGRQGKGSGKTKGASVRPLPY